MSGGISAGAMAAMAAGALVLSKVMAPKAAKTPDPVAPAALPQESKTPDEAVRRSTQSAANAAAAALGGTQSTWLSSTAGVDPAALNIGKSTLLGQ